MNIAINAKQDLEMIRELKPRLDLLARQTSQIVDALRQCEAQSRPIDREMLGLRLATLRALLDQSAKALAPVLEPAEAAPYGCIGFAGRRVRG